MCSPALHVTPWKSQSRTDGKLMGRAGRAAKNDLGREDVAGKAGQGRDLDPDEFAEGVTDPQVMWCDMEWYGFHRAAKLGAAGLNHEDY